MTTSNIQRNYRVFETETSFVFINKINFSIELDKSNGSFINGNLVDNEETQKLFRVLFNYAISLKK